MPIAEKDILRMAQKIQQNESENNVFRKQLDKYFRGDMPSHEVINVCSTPNILKLLNSTAKKVVLNQKDLENAVADSKSGNKSHTEGHDISKEVIYKLSEALRKPIMVLKGNKRNRNSVILITDLTNQKGDKVFVPISLDRQNGRISTISSLYGKKNLSRYLSEHISDILAVNKEKVDMLADTRDQYSQSINDTVTYFDNSIAYTTAGVKYPEKLSLIESKENIISLCSAISEIFTEQYNSDRHILNTNVAFTELSERCNANDVKSVIAAAILDRKNGIRDGRLTAKAEEWAASQELSESVKGYIEKVGPVPLDMKSGFFEVFAKKFDLWEQKRKAQTKDSSVLSRKGITGNAAQLHEQTNTSVQEKSAQSKKDSQSL